VVPRHGRAGTGVLPLDAGPDAHSLHRSGAVHPHRDCSRARVGVFGRVRGSVYLCNMRWYLASCCTSYVQVGVHSYESSNVLAFFVASNYEIWFSYFVFQTSYTCSYITLRDEQRAAAGSKFVALDDEATPSNGGNSNNFSTGSKGPHRTGKATASDSKRGTALNAAFNMAMMPAVAYPWRAVPVPLTAEGDLHQHQQVEVVNILHNQEQKNSVSKAREGDSNDELNPSGASTGASVFNVIHGQTLVDEVV
jgi:hypothetical protein